MLVEFDMHEGLPADLEIKWRGTVVLQRLDFLGVSFRCTFRKKMGHL
jgi:hypothetical protein